MSAGDPVVGATHHDHHHHRRHAARRAALQWLYRFDTAGTDDLGSDPPLPDEGDEPTRMLGRGPVIVRQDPAEDSDDDAIRRAGFGLATLAWEHRDEADRAVAPLTPEWPTHRQPVVDRNVLRLAWYEAVHAALPPRVAIDEAIELTREFSTERSPAFVNGVLDRLFRERLAATGEIAAPHETPPDHEGR